MKRQLSTTPIAMGIDALRHSKGDWVPYSIKP